MSGVQKTSCLLVSLLYGHSDRLPTYLIRLYIQTAFNQSSKSVCKAYRQLPNTRCGPPASVSNNAGPDIRTRVLHEQTLAGSDCVAESAPSCDMKARRRLPTNAAPFQDIQTPIRVMIKAANIAFYSGNISSLSVLLASSFASNIFTRPTNRIPNI